MTEPTPSDHTDLARLDKLERTVRRLRRWLWVALIIAIALISFALGRASANRQMMNNPRGDMMHGAPMFNSPARPPQQGPGNSGGPNMRGGDGNGGRAGDGRGGDGNGGRAGDGRGGDGNDGRAGDGRGGDGNDGRAGDGRGGDGNDGDRRGGDGRGGDGRAGHANNKPGRDSRKDGPKN